jgi:photosystem II stability/assembly factor-like uncharacterized protein
MIKFILAVGIGLCLFGCVNQKDKLESNFDSVVTTTPPADYPANIASQQSTPAVIYRSADGGMSWFSFATGIPDEANASSFLVIGDEIFATTDYHGIYSVREGEKQWKRIDEDLPKNTDINDIAFIGNTLVIGTQRHGVIISKNKGKNWSFPAVKINNTQMRSFYANGNALFAGADNGIHQLLDNGNTWEHVWKGVQTNGFTELNGKLYAGLMNGAIMSQDHGASWKYIYEPHTLHDISNDGESIYAMTLGAGLKKSNNNGLTWEDVNDGFGTLNFYTFEVKRYGNRLFAAQWHGIYTSANGGKNWMRISNGLPDSTAFTTLEVTRSGLIAGIGLRKK